MAWHKAEDIIRCLVEGLEKSPNNHLIRNEIGDLLKINRNLHNKNMHDTAIDIP